MTGGESRRLVKNGVKNPMTSLLEAVLELRLMVQQTKRYISSEKIKKKMRELYKERWVPMSVHFGEQYGPEQCAELEEGFQVLFENGKRHHVEKRRIMNILVELENHLERIDIENLRASGSAVEPKIREELVGLLRSKGFGKTIEYMRKAEAEFAEGKYKESCIQSRLALEEIFRRAREIDSGKPVPRGMLPNHIDYFKKNGLLSDAEEKLIRYGVYGFLSEKGNHATLEEISLEDAQLSININYSLAHYLLEKLGI
jgi:hypothetical protein